MRMAAKMSKSQAEVWDKVAETQEALGTSLGASVLHAASPTSYQLAVENEELQKRKEAYAAALGKILDEAPDAIGYLTTRPRWLPLAGLFFKGEPSVVASVSRCPG